MRLLLLTLLVGIGVGYHVEAQESSDEIDATLKVVRGFRDRRLFDLAEIYTRQQLQSESFTASEKALIVLEQIQMKVAQAITSSGDLRQQAWAEADSICPRFRKQFPGNTKQILIDVQGALVNFSHGNLIQQELEAEIVPDSNKQLALQQFRIATNKFRDIEKEIVARIPAAKQQSESGELTQDQLINLKNNIRYRLAVVNLAKAQLYDSTDQLNRVDALTQVLRRLDEVITQSNSELPLWWEAQISKAESLRLMQNRSAFNQLVSGLPNELLNETISIRLMTERVLAAVDFGDASQWQNQIGSLLKVEKPTPQLRIAVLKLIMNLATKASDSDKQQRQKQASQLVALIEQEHGKYWGRRAEIVLIGAVGSNPLESVGSSDLDILMRQGNTAFRKNNFQDAIKAYQKATKFAMKSDQGNRALATSVRLAQCHELLKEFKLASNSLFEVTDKFSDQKSADAVHLRGCWNLGQVKDESDALIDRLRTQIQRWPDLPTSDQARVWLGGALERKKDWEAAIKTYLAISQNSPYSLDAVKRVRAATSNWLNDVRQSEGSLKQTGRRIISMFDLKIETPIEWSDSQQLQCIAVVEVGLRTKALDPIQAIYMLESIVLSDTDAIPDALAWYVVAVASQVWDKEDELEDLVQAVRRIPNDPSTLRMCIDGLKVCLDENQREKISSAIEMICDKAMAGGATKENDFWTLEKAIASANSKETIPVLAKLAEEKPRSLRIQLAYARALSTHQNENAIGQWRRLAAKVKKGSDAWYEAKYNVVQLMMSAGQNDEAIKLAKYLELTTSGWKDSKWKKKFDRLIKK